MQIIYPNRTDFDQKIKQTQDNSLDFIVIVTAAFETANADSLKPYLAECVRALKPGGLLFVQGRPDYLPELGVYLDQRLNFKYWIAIESTTQQKDKGLPSVHAAVLLFTKGNDRFHVGRVRFPHQNCAFCKKNLRDWGGKAHLMHPNGHVISDIWTGLPLANNYTLLSAPALDTILRLLDFGSREPKKTTLVPDVQYDQADSKVRGFIGPKEGIAYGPTLAEPAIQYRLPGFGAPTIKYSDIATNLDNEMFNVVHCGDALEILRHYPDNSIDLVFADPPYNLDKPYNVYDDERENERYVAWCNAWMKEYARILKPTGSLYVLNLPHWTMYHAAFLNQILYFQSWIVWDALSEPRGKLMPAHYGLLFYTKHPTNFTFNYEDVSPIDARYYCLRSSCLHKRKALGVSKKEPLTDLWWGIHRIKHKRDRDYHPCQLPIALMERIIRLSTNPGDIVLDAFSGTGTTAVATVKLGRRYVAIDIDENYVRITKEKIAEVEYNGCVKRESIRKPQQRKYTKKELQLELRDLATKLGHLPTPEDVRHMSRYDLQIFFDLFPTWGKALKAAKLEVQE